MTPASGLIQRGKPPGASSSATRWVMSDVRRHATLAHRVENLGEVLWRRVAAAQERRFALVKLGIGERDRVVHDADQDVGPSVSDIGEPGHHRFGVSSRVDDDIEEVSPGELRQRFLDIRLRGDRVMDAKPLAAKVEAVLAEVQRCHLAVLQAGEQHAADPDRSRPDNQNAVAMHRLSASDGVGADRQEFDHGRLIERHAIGRRDIGFRDADIVRHASVDMHAQYADPLATIRLAAPARHTGAAGQIGNDVNLLADRNGASRAPVRHFAGQFVPDDPRIFQERMRTFKNMKIGAADAGAADSNQNLALSRLGSRPVLDSEGSRPIADQRSHFLSPIAGRLWPRQERLSIPTNTVG